MAKVRDLDGALRPLLGVSLLFGVWPRRPQAPGWVKVLAGAFTCAFTLMEMALLLRVFTVRWKKVQQTEIVATSFLVVVLVLTSAVNCACHVLRKDAAFSDVVRQVARVDSALGVDRSEVYSTTRKWVTITLAAILVWHGIITLLLATDRYDKYNLLVVLGEVNIAVTELQFVSLVLTLRHRFCLLNRKLATVFEGGSATIRGMTFRGLSPDPEEAVRNLQRVHMTLTLLGWRLNRFYGLQNMANVVQLFLGVTYVVFTLLLLAGGAVGAGLWAMFVSLLVMPTVKLVALAASCQKTETAAASTSLLVSTQQLRRWKLRRTTDAGALQALATQVEVMRLKFDAWSLFSIDGPLLRTVASTIVTYIIILLQFSVVENQGESSRDSCNGTAFAA